VKTLALTLGLALLSVLTRADIVFTWTNCPNRLSGSATLVWRGTTAPLNYSVSYPTFGTNLVFPDAALTPGFNFFACQQIATNAAGQVSATIMSGEIQVQVNPAVNVDVRTMASTNLGMGWTVVGQQTFTFPTATAQQQYFLTQQRISRTNIVILPPHP